MAAITALAAKLLLLSASTTISHSAAFTLLFRLRNEMVDGIAALPQAVADRRGTADLRRLVIEDIDQIEDSIAPAIPDPAQGIALPCLTFAALALIDWRLVLAAVTLFPLLLWLYPLTICAPREDYGRWYAALARLREATRHLVGGIAVIRAFVGAERGFDAHEQAVAAVRETGYRAGTASLWQMSLLHTGLRGNVLVLIPVGAAVFLGGDASAQDLVLILLLGLNASALRLIFTAGSFTWWIKAAMARIAEIRGISLLEQLEPAEVPRGNGLALERVALSLGERAILQDISLSVPDGGTLAIVGPSGAGKTTLLRVMDPDAGRITLGGADLRRIPAAMLSARFSAVLQRAWLTDATIRENIRAGRPSASDAEVDEAARRAQVTGFARVLPQGLDSRSARAGATFRAASASRSPSPVPCCAMRPRCFWTR